MSRVLIFTTLLAAALSHCATAAVNYCSSGSISTTNVVLDTAGESYTADGCSVESDAFLTINATQVPAGLTNALITAVFTNGKVGEGAGIEFEGPGFVVAATLGPFTVTISDSEFLTDAAIRLHGSLPPGSEVTVSGNVLSVSRAIYPDVSPLLFASPIYMYGYQDPYRLYPNSGYSIVNNDVECYSPSGAFACYGIGLWATMYMREGSWLDVSHNTINAIGTSVWWSDGIDGMQNMYIEGENTKITIDYNNVSLEMGSGIEPPRVYSNKNSNNGQGDFSAFVSISHNRFVGSPNPLYPEAVYLEGFTLAANSQYHVSYNYIEVHGTDARMSLNSLATLNDNAKLYIQYNTIIADGGTPQINTRAGGWILNSNSQLWITNNWLDRNDTAFPNRPYIQLDFRFMLIDQTRAYIMNNTFSARNTTRPWFVAGSTTNSYVYKADDARLKLCYNDYFGNMISTDEGLNATLTYNWFTLTDPVEYCWDKIPPGLNTGGEATKSPSHATSLSTWVAAGALLSAALAVLAV